MVILKAGVTTVHPHLNVIMFETMCLNCGLINEHQPVQKPWVHLVPCQQVATNTLPLLLFGSRQAVPECQPAVLQLRCHAVDCFQHLLRCGFKLCQHVAQNVTCVHGLTHGAEVFELLDLPSPHGVGDFVALRKNLSSLFARFVRDFVGPACPRAVIHALCVLEGVVPPLRED